MRDNQDEGDASPLVDAPSSAAAFAVLAQAQLAAEQYELARDTAREGLALDPASARLWRILGQAHGRLDESAEARAAYDQARALTPTTDATTRLALLAEGYRYALDQHWHRVIDLQSQKTKQSSAAEEARNARLLSALLSRFGHYAEALEVMRRQIALYPSRDPVRAAREWLQYARLLRRVSGDTAEIQAAIERALQLVPDEYALRDSCALLLRPLGVAPPEPAWLRELGFRVEVGTGGGEVLVPPVCEIPAGEFVMGSEPNGDGDAFWDEHPQHRVSLPTYAIGRFPVTVAEYAHFLQSGYTPPTRWHSRLTYVDIPVSEIPLPVTNVSCDDAEAYAEWLSAQTGETWRLPSEAEWEKAARWDPQLGASRVYPWGDQFDPMRCNTAVCAWGGPLPIGSHKYDESPFGARDLAGNVWEWTSSLYLPYAPGDRASESVPSPEGHTLERVMRGGSWRYAARLTRASCRGHQLPWQFNGDIGFRLVRVPERA